MSRQYLVNRNELKQRFDKAWEEEQKSHINLTPERLKILKRNVRANVYNEMRKEREQRHRELFMKTLDTGQIIELLGRHNIRVHKSDLACRSYSLADQLLKNYLERVVLPQLESELNIVGVTIRKNISANCRNYFNWDKASIKVPEELSHETNT